MFKQLREQWMGSDSYPHYYCIDKKYSLINGNGNVKIVKDQGAKVFYASVHNGEVGDFRSPSSYSEEDLKTNPLSSRVYLNDKKQVVKIVDAKVKKQ
jgi:hypothetical protein